MTRTIVIFISLLLVTNLSKAQNNADDKVLKELAAHPQQDDYRVKLLNELDFVSFVSPEEKEKYANEALGISLKTNNAVGKGLALAALAKSNFARGDNKKRIACFSRLIQSGSCYPTLN